MTRIKLQKPAKLQETVDDLWYRFSNFVPEVEVLKRMVEQHGEKIDALLDEKVLDKVAAKVTKKLADIEDFQRQQANDSAKIVRRAQEQIAGLDARLSRLADLADLSQIRSFQSSLLRNVDRLDERLAQLAEDSAINRKEAISTRNDVAQIAEGVREACEELSSRLEAVDRKLDA